MRKMSLSTYMCMQMSFVLLAAIMGGCVRQSPTAPVQAEVHYTPIHHNVPATFAGHPEGPIVYLCATQPRLVCDRDAYHCQRGEDHYLQYESCPIVPIE